MKKTFIILIILCINLIPSQVQVKPERYDLERLKGVGKASLQFCKGKKFNTDFCVLIDMSIHSGLNRLFVWNFKKQSIQDSGLCSHGCCDSAWGADYTKENPTFNNIPQSHCASLGKYKVGARGYSQWGINVNYKLHGLESSNSKAYDRLIVLHSWNDVSETEVFPEGTPEGWGCPAIANDVMRRLDKKLKVSKKPVLLWVFD